MSLHVHPAESRPHPQVHASQPIRPLDFTLQPGGRWERLLTALATQCLTPGELLRATDPRKHSRKVERQRILRALAAMAKVGLVGAVNDWGWTATAEGREALAALHVARGAARAQAARDRVPSVSAPTERAA